ncbi:MAG: glycoside hydrolase family 15 protein, partial [Actinomycetota bacterium]
MRIEDYALIADTHSAGLVSRTGSIDWLCLPRFDSASCFARILDEEHGGHWSIAPAEEIEETSRRYVDDTLILETTFRTRSGVVRLIDLLAMESGSDPEHPRGARPGEVVARTVACDAGIVEMQLDYQPRLDYAGVVPWFREQHGVIEAVGGQDALDLVADIPLEVTRSGVRARFSIEAGEERSFLAIYHPAHVEVPHRDPNECKRLFETSTRFWHDWIGRTTYSGRWRAHVMRSLLTLKALIYDPTGGVVAAPTTSLPEKIGGQRNWDYRYCWLRDATFLLDVLLEQGYTAEATEWRDWLLRSVAGHAADMQIMYGVMGARRLYEFELPLQGYENSRPVRIGNAAHAQFQLDVYGELMDSFHSARRAGIDTPPRAWEMETAIVEFVCDHW